MNSELEKLVNMLESEQEEDEKSLEYADGLREALAEGARLYFEDEDCDKALQNILTDDDIMLEEVVDKAAFVNFLEMPGHDEVSDEARESAWMSLADSFFELSRVINPLGGFGKDRLKAGLSIIKNFEKDYWPLSTLVTEENIEAFSDMLPNPFFDDIKTDRRHCIGALRHVGKELYAAGVIVYRIDEIFDPEAPLIRVDWIYVHSELREQGIGNFLMAQVMELALQNKGSGVCVQFPMSKAEDEEDFLEMDILESFLDAWKLEFTVDIGNDFAFRIADMKKNDYFRQKPKEEAITPEKAGKDAVKLLKDYFETLGETGEGEMGQIPFEYFDPKVSCLILSEGKISAVLLFHKYESGNYHYEALRFSNAKEVGVLLRTAYKHFEETGYDEDDLIFGTFDSEEISEVFAKVVPDAQVCMTYTGVLFPPEIAISNEEWDELRRKAGLSDDKIPDDELEDERMTDERMEYFMKETAGTA